MVVRVAQLHAGNEVNTQPNLNTLKKKFRKAKRRLDLGVSKPADRELLRRLSKTLNYRFLDKKVKEFIGE